jgi:recombination protein RecT
MADKQQNQLVLIHSNLEKMLKDKSKALPKNFNQTRFLQNAMVVLQDTKNIEKMQPVSVARTMLKGAFLGLDFFRGECYAIPYGDQLNFQTDFKGEIKLAKKYSLKPIHDIYAKLVREGDKYAEAVHEGIQKISFSPKLFSNNKIIGAFAVCLYDDGSMISETMSVEEIEKVRKTYSKQPDGKAWKESFGEMAKKTVLRRLCKLIEIEFDNLYQAEAYKEGGDAEFVNAEVVEPEPVRMPEPIAKFKNSADENVASVNLRSQIEKLFTGKKGKVSPEQATRIDNWITADARALTPDDIDEEGGKAILEELEKL